MALLTAERDATSRIKKQYRLRYRCENGTVCYVSINDPEGSELLFVHPDGSMLSSIIVGVCRECMFGAEHDCHMKRDVEPVEPVRVIPSLARDAPEVPVAEAEAPLEPEPVEDAVALAARDLANRIWSSQQMPRIKLDPTLEPALAHAVASSWLRVAGELIVRDRVDPRPAPAPWQLPR